MKLLFKSAFVIATIFSTIQLQAQLSGTSLSEARQSKTANFYYVTDDLQGFAAKDANGNATGVLVDLMTKFENYVKEKEGISITTEYVSVQDRAFDILMSEVKNGKGGVFGLSNVSITEERKSSYRFSPPYMSNVLILLTNSATPTLTDLSKIGEAFAGKTAYSTTKSSTYYKRLEGIRDAYFPGLQIVSKPSADEVLEVLASDNNAFTILDLPYYLQSLKQNSLKRHPVGDKGEDQFAVIMPLSNDWEPLLTEFLNSGYLSSAEYRMSVVNHLGKGALRLIQNVDQMVTKE